MLQVKRTKIFTETQKNQDNTNPENVYRGPMRRKRNVQNDRRDRDKQKVKLISPSNSILIVRPPTASNVNIIKDKQTEQIGRITLNRGNFSFAAGDLANKTSPIGGRVVIDNQELFLFLHVGLEHFNNWHIIALSCFGC